MEWSQSLGRRLSLPLGKGLARLGVSPNVLTAIGLLGGGGAGALLALGQLFWGGWLMLGAAAMDMLDGAVARASGRATRRGAFLDSVFDRLSEVAALSGLLAYFLSRGRSQEVALIFVATVGSILVSYMRARAEGLGISCREDLATRPGRVLILSLGLLTGQVTIALWVLAATSNLTALRRLVSVARQAGAERGG